MMPRILIGMVMGGALGLGCHKLAGCPTGACPLTRNPWTAMLYGIVVGALVAGSFH